MMADVINLVDRRRLDLPSTAADPVAAALAALAGLPRIAGLATRVRAMIEAGASDIFVDCYIASWCDSARDDLDENRHLHLELAKYLGQSR